MGDRLEYSAERRNMSTDVQCRSLLEDLRGR
jgi:hypothetical protein